MRQIGTLDNLQQAQRLADYLLAQGIKTHVDAGGDAVALWVKDEDFLEQARADLDAFRAAPDDPRYASAAQKAKQVRAEEEAYARRFRRNQIDLRGRLGSGAVQRRPLTMILIGISVGVSLLSNFGKVDPATGTINSVTQYSMISRFVVRDGTPWRQLAPEVRQGQVWRLVTPIFLHLSILHLVFNMLWLYQFGNAIENRRGTARFAALVLAIAVISNLAQYVTEGPGFGGMSGVVYGLFGYLWMKARFDPRAGFFMPPSTVMILIAWFFLCMTGLIGNVANVAHGAGLAVGIAVGLSTIAWRR